MERLIAIEPSKADYELLKLNIQKNNCKNVIPVNIGVGRRAGIEEITYLGRKFKFEVDSLKNILNNSK
jgi:FkbM family methyltransferase